ncbi:hypothetical protein ACJJTC_015046 [Scirpophaga incertulas]
MDPTEPVLYTFNMTKVNEHLEVLNGSFNTTRRVGPVFYAVRVYKYKSATRRLVFQLDHISCHNPFMHQFEKVSKRSLDSKCFYGPDYYALKSVHISSFKWLISKSFTTGGKYAYELEISHPRGVVACMLTVCEISVV